MSKSINGVDCEIESFSEWVRGRRIRDNRVVVTFRRVPKLFLDGAGFGFSLCGKYESVHSFAKDGRSTIIARRKTGFKD